MVVISQVCVEVPFNLTFAQLTSYQEAAELAPPIEVSLKDIADNLEHLSMVDRRQFGEESTLRILQATVCAVEAGVPLYRALHSALIWECG